MEIFTGYFAGLRKAPPEFIPVSVAIWPPKGFRGQIFRRFCPTPALLRDWKAGGMREEEYIARFAEETLDVLPERNGLLRELAKLGQRLLLCCYEKPEDFCHRHLVATRLREMEIECRERGFGKPPGPIQGSLLAP